MLKAPFPWFGGKSRVTNIIWSAFGSVTNYVEPFFGSGAVLLGRPDGFTGPETINDLDGFVSNFWRAIQGDPEAVAQFADWPVNENDLHARHAWLLSRRGELPAALGGDPDFFDAKIAGWWVWGICAWIGSGWCSGKGPWYVEDGLLVDRRQRPHLGDAGMGINRKRPHLSCGMGIHRKRPHLGDAGMGIHRQLPHLGDAGRGDRYDAILETFGDLQIRFREVRVCCGDWSRVMGESVTTKNYSITGIFLDPPYSDVAGRANNLYAYDDKSVAHDVREWCVTNGNNSRLRIALCGYEGEHTMPETWVCVPWKASGGYGSQGNTTGRENAARERIWFSPACLPLTAKVQPGLFDG